jgi:CheY-like chemotaxis protein
VNEAGPLHILLVENNNSDSEALARLMKRHDPTLRLTLTIDGDEALERLTTHGDPPNLVILDLGLTGRDGRDVLRAIKAHPNLRHIPVIVFTGSSRPTDVRNAYDAGASTFIRKPGSFEDFSRVVQVIHTYWSQAAVLPQEEAPV